MGGSYFVAAPRMTPEEQRRFNDLEAFKMREQQARGEVPTTFASDAYARSDADAARIAADNRRRADEARGRDAQRPAPGVRDNTAQNERIAEENRKAEAARKAEEVAKAEKLRKEKLAAEEAARKKEAERIANLPVEWKEGVVLCEPAKAPSRSATCHGPLQTTWGTLGEPSGKIALQQACGGDTPVRELGQAGGFLAFGCGWGIHPDKTSSDMGLRHEVSFIPGRGTFYCSRKQTTVCTSNTGR
ncbi:hypothetical protein [Sphingomonas soli]|uniref:hypothetical protein n=1 Tax=Sphingomonas soli TaxID=266127 RepID=UPI0012EE5C7E|nr:hypothetical protein [Sphingomonas soli]